METDPTLCPICGAPALVELDGAPVGETYCRACGDLAEQEAASDATR